MYQNLINEMKKRRVRGRMIADALGIHTNSVYGRINGRVPMSVDEALKIRDEFFPEEKIEYLFKADAHECKGCACSRNGGKREYNI